MGTKRETTASTYQILTFVEGRGVLAVAEVPAGTPDGLGVAAAIARALSADGHNCHAVDGEGRTFAAFTGGRRDPGGTR
jgi:hypothetical protein